MRKLFAATLFVGALAGATLSVPAQAQTEPTSKKVKTKKDKTKAKGDDKLERPEGRGPSGPGGPGNRMADMTKDLNLTADQRTRVQAIEKEQLQQMQTMRESGKTDDREAQMQRMHSFEEDTDQKMKGVLTPEQFQQYQAKKQERMRGGRAGGGQRPSGE